MKKKGKNINGEILSITNDLSFKIHVNIYVSLIFLMMLFTIAICFLEGVFTFKIKNVVTIHHICTMILSVAIVTIIGVLILLSEIDSKNKYVITYKASPSDIYIINEHFSVLSYHGDIYVLKEKCHTCELSPYLCDDIDYIIGNFKEREAKK